jgi:hypothetical protein
VSVAAVSTPALVGWVVGALVLGLVLGAAAATLVARGPARGRAGAHAQAGSEGRTPPGPGAHRVLEVDDLPAFLEHPPGSPGPVPADLTDPTRTPTAPATSAAPAAAAPTGATAVRAARPSGAGRHSPDALTTRHTLLAMAAAALVLVLVAVVIAVVGGSGRADDGAGDAAPASAPAGRPAGGGAPATRAEPVGPDVAARAAFGTVLLERRAVGVTVTRPTISASRDRAGALAHVLLPTYNCLLPEPPPDPEAAGCARAATEYADATGPDLRMTRDGDRVELAGRFATYTKPAGGPPQHTGRSYRLSAVLTAAGPERDGVTPASGVLRLGDGNAPTTGDPGANELYLRG